MQVGAVTGGVTGGVAGVMTGSAILPPAPMIGGAIGGCSGATAGFVTGREGAGFVYEFGKSLDSHLL